MDKAVRKAVAAIDDGAWVSIRFRLPPTHPPAFQDQLSFSKINLELRGGSRFRGFPRVHLGPSAVGCISGTVHRSRRGDSVRIAIAEVIDVLLQAVAVVLAFVLGLFVDNRDRLARVAWPPGAQIAVASVTTAVMAGSAAYFFDAVRNVPVLIGTAVLLGLIAPAIHLGNLVRDRVSPFKRSHNTSTGAASTE